MVRKKIEGLILHEAPKLKEPYLVAGFSGWPNAGEVATGAVGYLKDKLQATRFAELSPEDYYDFTSQRPTAVVEGGSLKALSFPAHEFFYWKRKKREHDLILLLGSEPHLRWLHFCQALLETAKGLGVVRVITLGGLFDRLPHTREPRITGVVNRARLKEGLGRLGIELTDYRGPSSFYSTLLVACARRRMDALSIWGHVPHYISVANPQVCLALVDKLAGVLNLELDLSDLEGPARELGRVLDRLMAQNSQLKGHVEMLEKEYGRERPTSPLRSQDVLKDVEEFLKRERGG
jgi:proteasome assembly chaperone (PAC2) family protein